jgi:hypothetical protein
MGNVSLMVAPLNTTYIQGQSQVNADGLNTFLQTVNTASDLRTFVGLPGMSINLLGIASVGDGSGGLFFWSPSSTAPDDNLNVIVPPSAASGSWLREGVLITTLPVNVAVVTVDGGGSPPATGIVGDDFIPVDCTAIEWVLQANTAGNVVVDIWIAPFVANTPPTVANSITGANLPSLTASSGRASAVLTGWSKSIAAGSWIRYNLVSVTTISRFTLTLVATVP